MMNESRYASRIPLVLLVLVLFACPLFTVTGAQGLPQLPGPGDPSNHCGCARGDHTIPISSGMLSPFLPTIPNLEFGFLYSFGTNVSTGRFTADYLLPFPLSANSVLFGEAHAEGWGFWKKPSVSVTSAQGFTTTTSATSNRIDLSFGGGYRTMFGTNALVGVNGFYDASHLYNRWYSSGGVGLEFAANAAGDDAIDLNVNWYGNLFNRDVLVNAFRNKGNSFDVEAGYSHALFDQALDLRLKLIGYQFDVGDKVYGWRGGADVTTRDGVFTLRYEYGRDRLNGDYNTVGGFINVGLKLENLLSGESPFTLPEPVFRSPRNLRRLLGLKVKRNWHQPAAVVLARARQSNTCPNLSGIVLIDDSIPTGTPILEGQIPPLASGQEVVFCWCNRADAADLLFRLYLLDGSNLFQSASSHVITGSDDCLADHLELVSSGTTGNGLIINSFLPQDMQFSSGGGISIAFP